MKESPKRKRGTSKYNRGITSIEVKGFKSLSESCAIDVKPITVLAGANSSGKSSIMQPLLLMKQTLESSFDPGPLLLDGPIVRFTMVDQILSRTGGKRMTDEFSIGVEIDGARNLRSTFRRKAGKGVELAEMRYKTKNEDLTLSLDMTQDEINARIPAGLDEIRKSIAKENQGANLRWTIARRRCFLGFGLRPVDKDIPEDVTLESPFTPGMMFDSTIRQIIHVPGLRGNPLRTYSTTSIGSFFPGTFEKYVASVMLRWQDSKDQRLRRLGDALELLGLTWKAEARQIDDVQVEVRVGRLHHGARGGARDMVNIADVGFGVSQTLPVVVALLQAQPGQLVYVEEPEIHLHPSAQLSMAKLFADAARRGVRLLIETHSSLIIRGIQTLVASEKVLADLVRLHWFHRGAQGQTEITPATLDHKGAFGTWPSDFDDVLLFADRSYLDAASKRSRG